MQKVINAENEATKMHAVILAGDRPGGNLLAKSFDLENGVLVKIHGKTCLQRVIEALGDCKIISNMSVIGLGENDVQQDGSLQKISSRLDCHWLVPETGPAASAVKAVTLANSFPCLLTTGDHALLSSNIIATFLNDAKQVPGDFIVGLVPFSNVYNAFPASKRTLLKFPEGVFCGSNLFLIKNAEGIKILEYWKKVEELRKKPWRIARQLGLRCLISYFAGLLSLEKALGEISSQAGAKLSYATISDPVAAIDIDTKADYDLAVTWLANEN